MGAMVRPWHCFWLHSCGQTADKTAMFSTARAPNSHIRPLVCMLWKRRNAVNRIGPFLSLVESS